MIIQPEVPNGVRTTYRLPFTLLRGSSEVLVREAIPEDGDGLRAMFARCSGKTIYLRFHIPYRTVPEPLIRLLVGATGRGGRAFVAVSGDEIVGHAMYAGDDGNGDAEVAMVVEDRWQAGGLGGLLLSVAAEEARQAGFEALSCFTLAENRRILGLAKRIFRGVRAWYTGGALRIRIPLAERDDWRADGIEG